MSNDEIDLTEILNEIPDVNSSTSIPSPNATMNATNNNSSNSNENIITVTMKVILGLSLSQLQKLPISSRIIHEFLILHIVLSICNVSQYLLLCPINIIDHYQYWRFITYNLSDSNVFMALIGCITLSDIIKRMEYYFGSLWTLYLFLTNWILLSLFTFIIQICLLPSIMIQCQCIGLYPMIFSLWIIEIVLSFPSQIHHIFGVIYLPQIYHPIIYCALYNILIRFDVATIIGITYTPLFLYCIPSIFHLSRYKIQHIESSKWLKCILSDKLFISIENIDCDSFIARGKYISAKSDKNTDLLSQQMDDTSNVNGIQYNMLLIENDENDNDYDDNREDLPFINHHDTESNAIRKHSNVPTENVDDTDKNNDCIRRETRF